MTLANVLARLKIAIPNVPNSVGLGVLGVVVVFVSMAGFNAVSLPWGGASDSMSEHYRYVEDVVSQGDVERNTFRASHPPLFYNLMAYAVGGFVEDGQVPHAVAIMRAINIAFGVLTVLALAWSGWVLGGRHRKQLAVATPALGVLITPYVITAGDIYSEPLVVLLATIGITLSALVIRDGPSVSLLVALATISVLGMGARSTYLAVLIVSILAVGVGFVVHRRGSIAGAAAKLMAYVASVGGLIAAFLGRHYMRNIEHSGSWFRGRAKEPFGGRDEQTVVDVLTNLDFYLAVPSGLFGMRSWGGVFEWNNELSLVIFFLLACGVVYLLLKNSYWKKLLQDKKTFLIVIMMLAVVALLYAQQFQHAVGWGNINPRYFLVGMLPIGMFMAYGAIAVSKFKGLAVPILMSIFSTGVIMHAVWFVNRRYGYKFSEADYWVSLFQGAAFNGLPPWLLLVFVATATLGIVVVAFAMRSTYRDERDLRGAS